jgi:hypothetical protein
VPAFQVGSSRLTFACKGTILHLSVVEGPIIRLINRYQGSRLADSGLLAIFTGTAVGTGSQSTEPAPSEKPLVRRVLLDVGSFAFFRGVGMMFMLHRLLFQHFGITPPTLLAAISWRNRRHAARHDEIQTLL